jgi:hypothetical protein
VTPSAAVLRGIGRLVELEARLYVALLRWCLRRKDVPATAEPWPYAALAAPVLWLWIFGSATEVVVLHLIIPWETVRIVVDIISIWGLLWMLGTLAAYRIRPHLLLPDELRIRNSVYHDISVPTSAIASGAVREVDLPSSMRALQIAADDEACHVSVGVSGRTNVGLTLRPGTPLETAKGTVATDTVRLWVDDPRSFVAHVNRQLAQAGDDTDARPPQADQR